MRSDRATCAICMDSLFHKLDDLDDVVPIVAPACGHVFHEDCIHLWFKSQETNYIAAARAHGDRDSSPHGSDAPAECPTCRQECFLTDDARYETTRLYINWGEQDGSSMAGSSPVRPSAVSTAHRRQGPSEAMLLARRAKGLGAEAEEMSADSAPDDVKGMLQRSGKLRDDLEDQKGIEGMRRYVGGLTAAINRLSTTLVDNPLTAEMQMLLTAQEHKVAEAERRLRDMADRIIPDQLAAARRAERKKLEPQLERLRRDADKLEQAVQEQKVLRIQLTKSQAAKMEDMEGRLAAAQTEAEKERKCRASLQEELRERTNQLRQLQAKAKSRKDLRTELEATRAELAALRAENESLSKQRTQAPSQLHHHQSPQRLSPAKRRRLAPSEDEYDPPSPLRSSQPGDSMSNDVSIQEISPTTYSQYLKPTKARPVERSDPADESLQIDMESFGRDRDSLNPFDLAVAREDDFLMSPSRCHRPAQRGNTTARSFTSDQFSKSTATSRQPAHSQGWSASSSKYFSSRNDAIPTKSTGSKTNPFSSSKADTEKRRKLPSEPAIIVPASSDKDDDDPDIPTRAPAASQRLPLPRRAEEMRPPRPLANQPHNTVRNASRKVTGSTGQPSIVAALGLADKNGRPAKGLAMGAKAGRRA